MCNYNNDDDNTQVGNRKNNYSICECMPWIHRRLHHPPLFVGVPPFIIYNNYTIIAVVILLIIKCNT